MIEPGRLRSARQNHGPDGSGIEIDLVPRRPRLHPQVGIRLVLDRAAIHDLRLPFEQFRHASAHVQRSAHEDHRGMVRRRLDERLEPGLLFVGRLALLLRHQEFLGLEDDDDPPRRHHRQRLCRVDQTIDLRFAPVHPLDVERLQPFVDDVGELTCHRRLLRIVGTDEHVERRCLACSDVFTYSGGSDGWHRRIYELTDGKEGTSVIMPPGSR